MHKPRDARRRSENIQERPPSSMSVTLPNVWLLMTPESAGDALDARNWPEPEWQFKGEPSRTSVVRCTLTFRPHPTQASR